MVPEGGGPLPAYEEGEREGGHGPQQAPLPQMLVLLAHLARCRVRRRGREGVRERGRDRERERERDGEG